jgi:hypothetical protein
MLFCGQCGLQLNADAKQCPRCGAPVEPGGVQEDAYAQPDAPTMASPSLLGQMQAQTPTPADRAGGDPQKLILRPDQNTGNSNYGTQDMYEATRRVELPEQGYGAVAPGTPSHPGIGPSHPADPQTQYVQDRGAYPPQNMYAEYPQSGSNYPPGASYPGPQGYQPYPAQGKHPAKADRGRTAALLVILLGLLLILVAMTLFILERNNVFGSIYSGNSGIAQNQLLYHQTRTVYLLIWD